MIESYILYIEYGASIILGLVLGSFASAIIYREINGLKWTFGKQNHGSEEIPTHRSCCPQCKTQLGVLDLVPFFSWALLKGRCRHCQKPISRMYPFVELVTLAACLGVYMTARLDGTAILMMLAMPFLVSLLVIDLKTMILPNTLVLAIAVLALINGALSGHIMQSIAGLVMYGGLTLLMGVIVKLILKKEALGMGDVKLFAAAGAWLGPMLIGDLFILSGLCGIVLGLTWEKMTENKAFPFGPAIILSLYSLLLRNGSFLTDFIIQ